MDILREIVVETPEALEACCNHLRQSALFGMDTEFIGENSYHPELCLIQVAADDSLYLIDPFAFESLEPFWKVVVDPRHTVVVHAGREEVRLCHVAIGQAPEHLVDLQIGAGLVGFIYPLGHAQLVLQTLGKKIKKGETLTDWRRRPLTSAQIRYAFDDVRYLLPVWKKLESLLEKQNRLRWAQEEFARLRDLATPGEPTQETVGEKWRRLRGTGVLDRRRLALVRELYLWREQKALELNRPARVVLRDDLVVEMARLNPKAPKDIAMVRGLAHRWVDEIHALLEKVREMPLEQCPIVTERDIDPPQVTLAVSVLMAVLTDYCNRNALAPNLVASNQDIKTLVRAFHQGVDMNEVSIPLTRSWRREVVLPHLQSVLEGRCWLRLADLQKETPFEYRPEL